MSNPPSLKLKLKLPSAAPDEPAPSADVPSSGPTAPSGVKLKLSLSGTGIKSSSNANAKQEQLREESEDEGRGSVGEASGRDKPTVGPIAGPTTKIRLNVGKLSKPTNSTTQTTSSAAVATPHETGRQGEGASVPSQPDPSGNETPAKRGRSVSSSRGKRGTPAGTRGRGGSKASGKARGRSVSTAAPDVEAFTLGEQDVKMDQGFAQDLPDQQLPAVVKNEVGGSSVPEPSRETVEQRMDVDPEPMVKPEPTTQPRAITPTVNQTAMTGNTTASVTFAIPSPELSPAPSLPPAEEPSGDTLMGDDLERTRSASVMTAPGGAADMDTSGLPTTASDMGTPMQTGTGMDELTEAMMAEAAAQGRVVLQGKGRPYLRAKKPLKDVLRKILADIRRKDAYGLFLDPVDEEEFPGYLDTIGGRENAMDLATMEEKIESGRYKTMDQFETDVEKMIRAAQVFNPDDSLVHREAGKIKTLAEKHISKNRPLIRTPSPSPEPTPGRRSGMLSRMSSGPGGSTPYDVGTPLSGGNGRSVSPGGEGAEASTKRIIDDLPPYQVIPEQMLDFPPNSDISLAVGWYFAGGKRFRSRKEQRAKEKWDGQWREWYTTGDRNLREADDLLDLFENGYTSASRGEKLDAPRTIDWTDEAMRAHEVWQPQPTYTGFEHEEPVPKIPMRPVDHWDFGRYQSLPAGYGWNEARPAQLDRADFVNRVKMDIRPPDVGPPGSQIMPWLRPEEDPLKYLKIITTGEDVVGEAYLKSVQAFVRGAEEGAKRNWDVLREEADAPRKKVKLEADAEDAVGEDLSLGKSLFDYVENDWRDGLFNRKSQRTIDLATKAYKMVRDEQRAPLSKAVATGRPKVSVDDMNLSIMKALVQEISTKLPIRHEVLEWAARKDGLELAALLQQVQDFSATGPAGGPPTTPAERAKWFTDSLKFTGDQIVRESKRLVEKARASGGKRDFDEEDNQRIREIRLNLLGLAKNVPVHELRPMSKDEAARLPSAVRNLIKIVPDRPKA